MKDRLAGLPGKTYCCVPLIVKLFLLLSRRALLSASCVLFRCVGDEVDNKEKVSQVCNEDDDDEDDPENRYLKTNYGDNLDWIFIYNVSDRKIMAVCFFPPLTLKDREENASRPNKIQLLLWSRELL